MFHIKSLNLNFYVYGWNIGFKTKKMLFVQFVPEMLNNAMMTSQCHVMKYMF